MSPPPEEASSSFPEDLSPQETPDRPDDAPPDASNELDAVDEGDLDVAEPEKAGKIIVSKNDRSLAELFRWYKQGKLIIDPEWQREYVWDRKRASKLLESILIDIPVPVIYLAQTRSRKYEVIDGQQRLSSVFDYFDDKLKLSGLEIKTELNGKKFKECEDLIKGKLEDATLRTFELSDSTPKDLMFLIFERLNTGGVALNDMEIRNCLYRGRLNDLLKKLRENTYFVEVINQKNIEKRMNDRMLVLRFLAFYERTPDKARRGLKSFLNEFFDTYRDLSDAKQKEYERVFNNAMRASRTIFGDNGFRLRRAKESTQGGEWTPKPNAAVFQAITVPFTDYDIGQLTRAADRIFEEYLDLIATDDKWITCVSRATGGYQSISYAFDTWKDRLAKALKDVPSQDKERMFSKQLKKEMFEQENTCSICKQEIKLLNDAALDHEKHYWRGGQTVPSNARLAHRLCNSERPQN